jgi:hypothetical protein
VFAWKANELTESIAQPGLRVNPARPNDKLPYRGAWLWVGSEMIHLMELPNPDPLTGRPEHGGRDRHTCIAIRDVLKLKEVFDEAGTPGSSLPPLFCPNYMLLCDMIFVVLIISLNPRKAICNVSEVINSFNLECFCFSTRLYKLDYGEIEG